MSFDDVKSTHQLYLKNIPCHPTFTDKKVSQPWLLTIHHQKVNVNRYCICLLL